MIDKNKIEFHMKEILKALGEDPEREGLKDTPKRIANYYSEVFEGINYTNDEIAEKFNVTFEDDLVVNRDNNDVVMIKDIEVFSHCEHHLALMYNMKIAVAYIPTDRVVGLSKIVRVCDMVAKRLQLQERIASDILYIIEKITNSRDVAIWIEGEHACMTTRGIKNSASKTVTTTFRGRFLEEEKLINRIIGMYKKNGN
ncbi:MAG: GTP cyclohydrolase I FolE [Fusobacteriaceae bacterium]|nr:GTP cyclohydrolase I FolE [Fusobacteriaceae bacterium]MBN2837571.1 GTP cyclohydrolase I FolE [Fusobacteriaceae bacterium]